MTDQPLLGAAVKLSGSMEALAALAAYARVEAEQLDVPAEVRDLLSAIAGEVLGGEPNTVGGPQAVGMVRAFLRQAIDLVESPGRFGQWGELDPVLLQGIGRLSMGIVDAVRAAEATLDGLGERLRAPGASVLDVGTGTAWLAIALAHTYPAVGVVGIDVFAPALALARANVAAEGMGERVEVRDQDVTALADVGVYDAVWLPLPFLPREIVPRAVEAAARSLRPGGWLLPGLFAGTGDRLSQLVTDLRTVRSGGHPWPADELLAMLAAHGLVDAVEVPRAWAAPVRLFGARRP